MKEWEFFKGMCQRTGLRRECCREEKRVRGEDKALAQEWGLLSMQLLGSASPECWEKVAKGVQRSLSQASYLIPTDLFWVWYCYPWLQVGKLWLYDQPGSRVQIKHTHFFLPQSLCFHHSTILPPLLKRTFGIRYIPHSDSSWLGRQGTFAKKPQHMLD